MRIVIAGGGLAAQRAAETLRRSGHDGPLTMVCAEDHLPYDRPPLSKEVLAGTREPGSLAFRDEAWYRDHDVDLLLGTRATGLWPGRLATTGGTLGFDRLLAATGARPRELPGALTLRDRADAVRLREQLRPGRHVVIVGGGFVGLEVAASATCLGARVTVVEAAPTLLARVLGPAAGAWFAGFHRRHGVEVLTGTTDAPRGDVTVAAIGITPATEWLSPAPHVHVAGDAAGHHHWEAAARGGAAAARAMLGLPAQPDPLPAFWSDQHGVRIQLVGDPSGAERSTTESSGEDDFATTFWHGTVPVAVLLVGRPGALAEARRLVAGAITPERKAA